MFYKSIMAFLIDAVFSKCLWPSDAFDSNLILCAAENTMFTLLSWEKWLDNGLL